MEKCALSEITKSNDPPRHRNTFLIFFQFLRRDWTEPLLGIFRCGVRTSILWVRFNTHLFQSLFLFFSNGMQFVDRFHYSLPGDDYILLLFLKILLRL